MLESFQKVCMLRCWPQVEHTYYDIDHRKGGGGGVSWWKWRSQEILCRRHAYSKTCKVCDVLSCYTGTQRNVRSATWDKVRSESPNAILADLGNSWKEKTQFWHFVLANRDGQRNIKTDYHHRSLVYDSNASFKNKTSWRLTYNMWQAPQTFLSTEIHIQQPYKDLYYSSKTSAVHHVAFVVFSRLLCSAISHK